MSQLIARISGSRIVGQSFETNTQNRARHRAEARGPLAGLFDGTEWHPEGSCYKHPNPEWWFPEVGGVAAREAKAICAECPVGFECGEWAIATRQEYGIWGSAGLNGKAIKRIRRQRKAQE